MAASTSTARRRSTVHDYSALRLHPDGTRVPTSSSTPPGRSSSRMRNAGRDARGNPIALDAAGLGVVPKRTTVREVDPDEGRDDIDSHAPQRSKRRRMDAVVEFLGSSGNGTRRAGGTIDANANANDGEEVAMMTWPVPSSDLLKCVHHFASRYYAACGLLSDQSRVYRREVRRGKTMIAQTADSSTDAAAAAAAAADAEDLFAEDEEESENDLRREDRDAEGGERKGSPSESVLDMYKAFDGSALMAIGMLLQEHISMLLKPRIPPEWEEEMEAAGLLPEDEVAVLEGERLEDGDESDKSGDEEIAFEYVFSNKD